MKRIISILLALALFCGVLPCGVSANEGEYLRIENLKVNSLENPIGIDSKTPLFSYNVATNMYGKSQSAYRIQVKEGERLVWDSGKVNSDKCYDIKYNGQPLSSKTRYTWTVEVWDEKGKSIGVSTPAYFATGFLEQSDWSGKWIFADVTGGGYSFSGAKWIWLRNGAAFNASPAGDMYFRKKFTLNKEVEKAVLIFTADDMSQAYVNGDAVGSSSEWASAQKVTITNKLVLGENCMAFKATNSSNGYAGLLCKLIISYKDGSSETIISDNSFLVSGTYENSWYTVGFSDSSWKAPDQAENYGNSPWDQKVSFGQTAERAAPLFRKEFSVNKTVSSATAYVCAAGLFDMEINGQKVTQSVLNPANTDYNKTLLYCSYDVTSLISQGQNAVGVMLGNGFYNSILPGWNWSKASWRTQPKLLMEINIKYTDGSSENIVTDGTFKKTLDGPITENDIYYGETYDANKALNGYSTVGFDDSSWSFADVTTAPAGKIKAQTMEPITKTQEPGTVTVTKVENSYIIKAPVVSAGWLGINFYQPKDTKLTITYGEKLNSKGLLVTKEEDGRTTQRDNYICSGSLDYYEPRFSYKGFQYVQVDGAVNPVKPEDVKVYQVHNSVAITGSFDSSNQLINSLHEMMVRTMLNNFQGKPTDTPFLEKNGWLGDANISLETFFYNFGVDSFLTKFMGDMEDAQRDSGLIPSLVPIYEWGIDNVPVWNSIFIFTVEQMYKNYGKQSYIEKQYDAMRKLIKLDIDTAKSNGWLWNNNGLYSDWVSPMGGQDLPYKEACPEGSNIYQIQYVYKALCTMSEFARILGKTNDAQEYDSAAESIKTAFNKKYLNTTKGIYESDTWDLGVASSRTRYRQSANILPLALGLVPDDYRQKVIDNLIADIVSKGYHLDTGIIGTKYILPVLTDCGYSDIAYRILTQTSYPSWGFWYATGATTMHEMWETTSRSFDHYFLGTFDEWLYRYIGGIDDIKDGYKTFTYRPTITGDLTYAGISLDTVRGKLTAGFTRNQDGSVTFKLYVPFGSTAKAVIPTSNINGLTVNGKKLSESIEGVGGYSSKGNNVEISLSQGYYQIGCSTNEKLYKLALKEAVSDAEKYAKFDYTKEAWSQFESVLNNAKEKLERATVQTEINGAVKSLNDAVTVLNQNKNKSRTALRDLIYEITEISQISENNVIKEKWAVLDEAIKNAMDILGREAGDDQVNSVTAQLAAAYNEASKYRVGNLAKGKAVIVSSDVGNSNWNASLLTDGNRKNQSGSEYCGWSSSSDLNKNHTEWAIVDLGAKLAFDTVTIWPSTSSPNVDKTCYGLPEDYTISISDDNENYIVVYEKTGQPLIGYQPVVISVGSQRARYIKITGNKLRPKVSDGNTYRMQLAEVEVYNNINLGIVNIADKYYYYEDGFPIKSTLKEVNGKTYFFNFQGEMLRSKWQTIEQKKYYFDEKGEMQTLPYIKIENSLYSFNPDGSLRTSTFFDYNNDRYYASNTGSLYTDGWYLINGILYCFDSSGKLLKNTLFGNIAIGPDGTKLVNSMFNYAGKTYITDSNGIIIKGRRLFTFGQNTYFISESGSIEKGKKVVTLSKNKYVVAPNGAIYKKTMVSVKGKTYYLDSKGVAVKNKVIKISGSLYAFGNGAYRLAGTKFVNIGKDQYYLKKGKVVSKQKFNVGKNTYYADSKGRIVKNKLVKIGKNQYYFNKKGIMEKYKKSIKIGKKTYKIDKKGRVLKN